MPQKKALPPGFSRKADLPPGFSRKDETAPTRTPQAGLQPTEATETMIGPSPDYLLPEGIRAPLASVRNFMMELPQEVLGTVAPMAATAMGGLGGFAARTGLSAVGGAAGRAISEGAKHLPPGLRGFAVGGFPGAVLDVLASATMPGDTAEPGPDEPRPRETSEVGEDVMDAALLEGGIEAAGGTLGKMVGAARRLMGPGKAVVPKSVFEQVGKEAGVYKTPYETTKEMARAKDIPIIPSDVMKSGAGVGVESLARYGSGGRRMLEDIVETREQGLRGLLETKMDEIAEAADPKVAGMKFVQNLDAYRKEAFDDVADKAYAQAEQLMAMQTRQVPQPPQPIYDDLYKVIDYQQVPAVTEEIGPFVGLSAVKDLIAEEWGNVPNFLKSAMATENVGIQRFISKHGTTIPDQVSFADARALRSDLLSVMRQGTTSGRLRLVESKAVGLYNKAMEDAAKEAGVPEAFEIVSSANDLWKDRMETFYNTAVELLMTKGDNGPELVGKIIWKPGAITPTEKAFKAAGGAVKEDGSPKFPLEFAGPDMERAWNVARRAGFQDIADKMDKVTDPTKVWTGWWSQLHPDQRLLLANGDKSLKQDYDELFHALKEFSASASRERSKGLGLQSPEKTAMVYAALAASGVASIGGGYAAGGLEGGGIGTVGFVALAFGGPPVMAKLLLSKPGTRVLIDGVKAFQTPNGFTAENIIKYGARALSVADNTNQETGRYEKAAIPKAPSVETPEGLEEPIEVESGALGGGRP